MLGDLKSKIDDLKHRWNSADEDVYLYSLVAEEIEAGTIHKGLWLKALSESDSDEHKAKAKYTKYRVAAVRKVIPEITSLLAAEKRESEMINSLEKKIASAEGQISGLTEEYELLSKALEPHQSSRALALEKRNSILEEYEKKLDNRDYITETFFATWKTRVVVSVFATFLIFFTGSLIGIAFRYAYIVIAVLGTLVASNFIISGPTYTEKNNLEELVAELASGLRAAEITLAKFDVEIDRVDGIGRQIETIRSSRDALESRKERCAYRMRAARESIVEKLAV